jgi:hypothetical protein
MIASILPEQDRRYLLAAAYLHDEGYAPELWRTGFHSLDGASFVIGRCGDQRLACLVAHHSDARFQAALMGCGDLLATFPRERSALADALTYCDQLTGPTGARMSFRERVADVLDRHGQESTVAQATLQARPYLALAIARTTRGLQLHGIAGSPA